MNMDKHAQDSMLLAPETQAAAYRAHGYTFRLIDRTDATSGGTCVSIKIGSRVFLATAGHVLDEGHRFAVILRNLSGECIDEFVCAHRDVEADVGLLELTPQAAARFQGGHLDEKQLLTSLDREREWDVLVIGYPAQCMIPSQEVLLDRNTKCKLILCNAHTYASSTIPLCKYRDFELDQTAGALDGDVFVHYDPGEILQCLHSGNAGVVPASLELDPPRLPGMSGGGVWVLPEPAGAASGVWAPLVRLVALQVSWMPGKKWLRSAGIGRWLDLVERHYPDLARNVARIRKSERGMS